MAHNSTSGDQSGTANSSYSVANFLTAASTKSGPVVSSSSDVKLFFNTAGDREISNTSTVADYDFDDDTILYMVFRRRRLQLDDSDEEEEDDWEDIQVDELNARD